MSPQPNSKPSWSVRALLVIGFVFISAISVVSGGFDFTFNAYLAPLLVAYQNPLMLVGSVICLGLSGFLIWKKKTVSSNTGLHSEASDCIVCYWFQAITLMLIAVAGLYFIFFE